MVQLRHDYQAFNALNTEVLAMVPNGPRTISLFRRVNTIPYPILTDKGARVGERYLQVKHLFKLGVPSVFLVDRSGEILYVHYARSLVSEPDNREPLAVLKAMRR